ncbi:hypothetical protein TNCV_4157461 [Trichonephila clavipes]|nr:hypothetical protein TNCV_4157461 [Trichonephila clavipes]
MSKGTELTRKRFRATKQSPGIYPTQRSIFIEQNHTIGGMLCDESRNFKLRSSDKDNARVNIPRFKLLLCSNNEALRIITGAGKSTPVLAMQTLTNTEPFSKSIQRKRHDEAHFWLNGYVNKQNCRIWSKANPQVYVETPLNPEKLTVLCALWAGGILLQKR